MQEQLNPCPFCGGTIRHYHTSHIDLKHRNFQYECTQCDSFFAIPQESKYKSAEETKKEIVTVWNEKTEFSKKKEDFNGAAHT